MLKRNPAPVNGYAHKGSIINIASLVSFQGTLSLLPCYAVQIADV
jgi:short-subunit dehydrogenase